MRQERHDGGRDAQQQTHPEHGTGEELLRAIAALLFPHPDQRRHERLIHRLGDEVDEQAGDERGGEECVHGVGTAIDRGNRDFLEGGDELDQDAGGADRHSGAEDAAIDAKGSGRRGDGGGKSTWWAAPPLRIRLHGERWAGASAIRGGGAEKQAVRACESSAASRAARTIRAKSSHVVRFPSTVATSDVTAQTSSAVTRAMRSGPWVSIAERAARATRSVARNKAQSPPPTASESAVLCAVSTGDRCAARRRSRRPYRRPAHARRRASRQTRC